MAPHSVPPRRRGRIVRRTFANPKRLDSSQGGMRCSLSQRERARVRGKAACNSHGLVALPGVELCAPSLIDFIGSSPARWFAERFFPLTPSLSLGERENRPPLSGESNALGRAGISAL